MIGCFQKFCVSLQLLCRESWEIQIEADSTVDQQELGFSDCLRKLVSLPDDQNGQFRELRIQSVHVFRRDLPRHEQEMTRTGMLDIREFLNDQFLLNSRPLIDNLSAGGD